LPDRTDVANLLAAHIITQLMEAGNWEDFKELLPHNEAGAVAAAYDVLDSLDVYGAASRAHLTPDQVAPYLDERTRNDAIYRVLVLATMEERPILSTVLTIRSALTVGNSLTKATEGLTSATEAAGRDIGGATRGLKRATWWLMGASGALVVVTVVLVIVTWVKG
jgi:hypothetical protein